jgi:RNA polymerase sigma-B factor
MVAKYLPLVRRLCGRFRNSGEPMDDLVQIGSVGLLKAIDKYDPEIGNNFMAFAVPVIVGEIKNYFRDHGWSVRIPRKLQSRRLAVERTIEPLTQALGRRPTVPEIADATGLSPEEIYDTFEVERYGKPLSLDLEYRAEDGEDPSSLLDYLGGQDPAIEGAAGRLDLERTLERLDERERSIIYLCFYRGIPQTDIARRLGISQMHVSRLQRKALNKLRSDLAG